MVFLVATVESKQLINDDGEVTICRSRYFWGMKKYYWVCMRLGSFNEWLKRLSVALKNGSRDSVSTQMLNVSPVFKHIVQGLDIINCGLDVVNSGSQNEFGYVLHAAIGNLLLLIFSDYGASVNEGSPSLTAVKDLEEHKSKREAVILG